MRLRGKLLLLSLSLLVLPWAGWQFLRLMGEVLREGQEQAQLAAAEALARGLAQRPNQLPATGPALYAPALTSRPRLDGEIGDWPAHDGAWQRLGDSDAGVALRLASHDDTVYLYLDVADDSRQRGDAHWPIAERLDHVRLTLHGRQGVVALRLANAESGPLRVADIDGGPPPLRLAGHWRETGTGYAIEAALPQGYALRALAVAVHDVDERDRVRVHDSTTSLAGRPWTVRQHLPALDSSLAQLRPAGMRVALHDDQGWLLAQAGALATLRLDGAVPVWRRWLYRWLLFADDPEHPATAADAVRNGSEELARAAAGDAATAWHRDRYSQRLILSAAVPVVASGETRGVLLLERESDALLRLTDRAFSGLFGITALAVLATVMIVLLFAGRLGGRIRRLRDATETALDQDGRVRTFPVSSARDEIGDLSRSFARLLDQVRTYTEYLRGLAGKLSHEINTPIAIVRTSLENLEADPGGSEARVYLERARGGIERLGTLVRAMSEASRIEQAIAVAERERFDLRALVADCAEGYRPLLAPRSLEIDLPTAPVPILGSPDLIAQALDKLVDNAASFCPADGWVRISLRSHGDGAELRVANRGPALPTAMAGKLFDSLVSVRERRGSGVHLGFGLHVVRLIALWHRGEAVAQNLAAGDGVEFTVTLHSAGDPA